MSVDFSEYEQIGDEFGYNRIHWHMQACERMRSTMRKIKCALGRSADACAFVLVMVASSATFAQSVTSAAPAESREQTTAKLRAWIAAAPELPLVQTDLAVQLPVGQELGKVSWLARDPKSGVVWMIQRGEKADPVIAVDVQGRVLHSFGKGLYTIPHAIRLDPQGNVWTVDAGSSTVIEYSPQGERLLTIDVGGMPERVGNGFRGTTDIAFAAKGRVFVSDGYANARVVEYTMAGKKVREWGVAGTGAGEFHLPHSIVVDEDDVLYVADRENGRIEKFDLEGKFLGEIETFGRTYSLKLGADGTLWAGIAPLDAPTGAPGWLVKLDRRSGKILGYVPVTEQGGLHTVEDAGNGRPMTAIGNRVVWFKGK
jgi:streptogramin lyase